MLCTYNIQIASSTIISKKTTNKKARETILKQNIKRKLAKDIHNVQRKCAFRPLEAAVHLRPRLHANVVESQSNFDPKIDRKVIVHVCKRERCL